MNRRDFFKMFGISALVLPFVKPFRKAPKTKVLTVAGETIRGLVSGGTSVVFPTNMGRGEVGQILFCDDKGKLDWVYPSREPFASGRRTKGLTSYDAWS